jgi:predicted nucleic acid-binding Zn ribbon protein
MAIRGKSQTLDHVLSELIDTYKLRGKLDEVELHRFWAELLGPQINAQTEGLYLQGEKVMVRLSSSVLRSELSMAKDSILAKINQRFGSNRVKDLIFI